MKVHIIESIARDDEGKGIMPDSVEDIDLVEAAEVVVGIDDEGTVHVLRNDSGQQLEFTSEVV